jgi:hypothetical protein
MNTDAETNNSYRREQRKRSGENFDLPAVSRQKLLTANHAKYANGFGNTTFRVFGLFRGYDFWRVPEAQRKLARHKVSGNTIKENPS